MAEIKIKHFNGLLSDWERRVAQGDFVNDIVFAKAWTLNSSDLSWNRKLVIYAGKDNLNQEYIYEIPDFSTFITIKKLIDISNGGFTSLAFRNSLENYIIDSNKILDIDSSISLLDQEITELADVIVSIDSSVKAILNNVNGLNTSVDIIEDKIDELNTSVIYIQESIDWVED